jgi:hypothetical protein
MVETQVLVDYYIVEFDTLHFYWGFSWKDFILPSWHKLSIEEKERRENDRSYFEKDGLMEVIS